MCQGWATIDHGFIECPDLEQRLKSCLSRFNRLSPRKSFQGDSIVPGMPPPQSGWPGPTQHKAHQYRPLVPRPPGMRIYGTSHSDRQPFAQTPMTSHSVASDCNAVPTPRSRWPHELPETSFTSGTSSHLSRSPMQSSAGLSGHDNTSGARWYNAPPLSPKLTIRDTSTHRWEKRRDPRNEDRQATPFKSPYVRPA